MEHFDIVNINISVLSIWYFFHAMSTSLCSRLIYDSPQSVPSPLPLDSGEVSISSGLDRKSKPFSASSVSGSSLVSILAGDDEGFFLRILGNNWKSFWTVQRQLPFNFVWVQKMRADFLTVLDSTLVLPLPSLSSSSSSSLNSAAAFSMNLKASSTALVSESSAFLLRNDHAFINTLTRCKCYWNRVTFLLCVGFLFPPPGILCLLNTDLFFSAINMQQMLVCVALWGHFCDDHILLLQHKTHGKHKPRLWSSCQDRRRDNPDVCFPVRVSLCWCWRSFVGIHDKIRAPWGETFELLFFL